MSSVAARNKAENNAEDSPGIKAYPQVYTNRRVDSKFGLNI
jgi:hypothetical protein